MPGVLVDTQSLASPFDRRHHPHPFHGSSPLSSPITCSISTSPDLHHLSPDSPPLPLRFGDLPSHSFPPGFFLPPPGIPSSSPSLPLCCSQPLPSPDPASSFLPGLDAFRETIVDENGFSGRKSCLPKLGVPSLSPGDEQAEFSGLSHVTDDGDGGAVITSLDGASGGDSEGIHIPGVVMAAAAASNYGAAAAGACMVGSPVLPDTITALQKFLPSNNEEDEEFWPVDSWPAMDVYSCDDFRMYEFKVRRCMRGRSHDWTECPFAHPGEKARRRDPRKFHYSGTACPDFRKGSCKRGEACEYAHGVFECWLHPARYRTQPCKDGRSCRRRVCFFAHTTEQLRVLPAGVGSPPASLSTLPASSTRSSVLKAALSGGAYDGSPLRQALASSMDGALALELLYEQGLCKTAASQCGAAGLGCYSATTSPTSTLLGHNALSSPPSPSSSASSSPPLSPSSSPSSAWPRSPTALPSPAQRRHLERLHSFPTVSIPAFDDRNLVHLSVSPDIHSPRSMNDLISTLQQLHLKGRTVDPCRVPSFPWLSPHYSPRSVTGAPRSRYACKGDHREANEPDASSVARMLEPGCGSREKISGRSTNESSVENDAPDFDWVNELVK